MLHVCCRNEITSRQTTCSLYALDNFSYTERFHFNQFTSRFISRQTISACQSIALHAIIIRYQLTIQLCHFTLCTSLFQFTVNSFTLRARPFQFGLNQFIATLHQAISYLPIYRYTSDSVKCYVPVLSSLLKYARPFYIYFLFSE